MSRPFINQEEEGKVKGLLATLKRAEQGPAGKAIEIEPASAHELVGLIELLLTEKPIVLEETLTPAEAAKIAQVSRPLIVHLLASGKLQGYKIGTGKHWKIKRDSLVQYMRERDELTQALGEVDKDGFGLD